MCKFQHQQEIKSYHKNVYKAQKIIIIICVCAALINN